MPEPKDHIENRGAIETILRSIPGFRGYLEAEYRRDSDRLQREWLADRLARSKASLDDVARAMTEAGALDALPSCERLRGRLDRFISRLRGAMPGYSGFFDLVQVDVALLDRVYEHDVAIMDEIEALAEAVEQLKNANDPAAEFATLQDRVVQVEQTWDTRADILKGLE